MMVMMMMAMTICFTEATRLLESNGSAAAGGRATIQNEQGMGTMCSENVQCAMKMCNVQ